jgi:hypothetical protein
MITVTAPEYYRGDGRVLFLGGAITGAPNWQAEALEALAGTDLVVCNPRRPDFPIDDPRASFEQISWEYTHLRRADGALFWFPCETIAPIALFELGRLTGESKPIFVGRHPDYARKVDVDLQVAIARPGVRVVQTLPALLEGVRSWAAASGGETF